MKKPWLILLLMLAGTLGVSAGDFTLTIRGTTKRNRISTEKKENLSFRKTADKQTMTLQFHAGRDFSAGKAFFKVKKADEFSFSIAGEYTRNSETKHYYYHWIEVESLKVNNTVLIGKGSKTNPEPVNVSKRKVLADKIKVRSNGDLIVEIKFRNTPKADASALSEKEGTSDYRKALKAKRERQEKKRQERMAKRTENKTEAGDDGAEEGADTPKTTDSKKADSKKADSKKADNKKADSKKADSPEAAAESEDPGDEE